jgi:glycosyltransferase involved in cell wall biosynthesis
VITEAMASGLPVVATDIVEIPEQIEHEENGFLIPTGDAEALADRLNQLLADSQLREQMGERIRACRAGFDYDDVGGTGQHLL